MPTREENSWVCFLLSLGVETYYYSSQGSEIWIGLYSRIKTLDWIGLDWIGLIGMTHGFD